MGSLKLKCCLILKPKAIYLLGDKLFYYKATIGCTVRIAVFHLNLYKIILHPNEWCQSKPKMWRWLNVPGLQKSSLIFRGITGSHADRLGRTKQQFPEACGSGLELFPVHCAHHGHTGLLWWMEIIPQLMPALWRRPRSQSPLLPVSNRWIPKYMWKYIFTAYKCHKEPYLLQEEEGRTCAHTPLHMPFGASVSDGYH